MSRPTEDEWRFEQLMDGIEKLIEILQPKFVKFQSFQSYQGNNTVLIDYRKVSSIHYASDETTMIFVGSRSIEVKGALDWVSERLFNPECRVSLAEQQQILKRRGK